MVDHLHNVHLLPVFVTTVAKVVKQGFVMFCHRFLVFGLGSFFIKVTNCFVVDGLVELGRCVRNDFVYLLRDLHFKLNQRVNVESLKQNKQSRLIDLPD